MNVFQSQLLLSEGTELEIHNRLSEGTLSDIDDEGFGIDPLKDYCVLVGKLHNPYNRRQISIEEFEQR